MAVIAEDDKSRKEKIISQVKAAGMTLLRNAEDIVGWNAALISGLDISISIGIPIEDGDLEAAPEINVDKSFVSGRMTRAAYGEWSHIYDEGEEDYDD